VSIFFICGKPGGGKSYLGVKQICEELKDEKSTRYIVTNISLKLPELAEWCHKNCSHEVNLQDRIRILDEAQTGEFWKFEPNRVWDERKKFHTGEGKNRREYDVPNFDGRGERGTLYVIDEVHVHFGAREWQQTGTDCTWFLTQHRKLGCDVIFITQHPEQTDKALRRLAQEYMTVRNLSREPVMGFRAGNLFRYIRSLNSPNTPNAAPFESGFVKLRPEEYGQLYDTTAGVGIAGRVAPRQEKRGRSLWWLVIPVVAILAVMWNMKSIVAFISRHGARMVNSGINGVMTNSGIHFSGKGTNQAANLFSVAKPQLRTVIDTAAPVAAAPIQKTQGTTNSLDLPPTIVRFEMVVRGKGPEWIAVLNNGKVICSETEALWRYSAFGIWQGTNFYVFQRYLDKPDPRVYYTPVATNPVDSVEMPPSAETKSNKLQERP